MADDPGHLSESLGVLRDLLLAEDGPPTAGTDSVKLVEELSEALASQSVIDQATGILMTRLAYDSNTAFDLLERVSADSDETILVIARRMVASVTRISAGAWN